MRRQAVAVFVGNGRSSAASSPPRRYDRPGRPRADRPRVLATTRACGAWATCETRRSTCPAPSVPWLAPRGTSGVAPDPSYDDILDACCAAWNALLDDTGRIRSLCAFDWASVSSQWGWYYGSAWHRLCHLGPDDRGLRRRGAHGNAGKAIDQATENAGKVVGNAAEKAGDAAENAGDAVKKQTG